MAPRRFGKTLHANGAAMLAPTSFGGANAAARGYPSAFSLHYSSQFGSSFFFFFLLLCRSSSVTFELMKGSGPTTFPAEYFLES
jgi:hypothetical protein